MCRKLEAVQRLSDLANFKEDLCMFEGFEFLKLNQELKNEEMLINRQLAVKSMVKWSTKRWEVQYLQYGLKKLQQNCLL